TARALRRAVPSSTPAASAVPPPAATRAATPHSRRTGSATAPEDWTGLRGTPRTKPPPLVPTHSSTSRPRLCDASSPAAHAPRSPIAAAAHGSADHGSDQKALAPLRPPEP